MCDFVKHPNLPDGFVTLAVAKNMPQTVNALQSMGIKVLSPAKNSDLPNETAEHSDMLICHTGGNVCFTAPEQTKLKKALTDEGFSLKNTAAPGAKYPEDIKMNIAVGKNIAIGLFAHTDETLTDELRSGGYRLINVKQGYAKCSVCFVTENAFITEDPSIARTLTQIGADVLKISHGDIYLSETHSGFFGGSSGKISNDILAVNGELRYHSDGERIKEFTALHGVKIKELICGRITDIGGILPLKQKN